MSDMINEKQGRWLRVCGSIRTRLFSHPVKEQKGIRASFGEHYYLRLTEERGRNYIEFGTNHHGVKFCCTDVGGEFEKIIEELRVRYPENRTD